MLTLEEMKNINFHKAGFSGGYKTEEVDLFIDQVIEKIEKMQEEANAAEKKMKELEKTADLLKDEKDSLSNVFIKAQKAAASIEKESKEASEKTLSEAEKKASMLIYDAQKKAEKILKDATEDSARVVKANDEKIRSQEALYEQLQTKVADFRRDMVEAYKEHLKLLKTLPDLKNINADTTKSDEKNQPVQISAPSDPKSALPTSEKNGFVNGEKSKIEETPKIQSFYDQIVNVTVKPESNFTVLESDDEKKDEKNTEVHNNRQPVSVDDTKNIPPNI